MREKRDLFRALAPATLVREAPAAGEPRVMAGHFAVFRQWTEIDSFFEGRFMERFDPGAFKKTLGESRQHVLFQHGRDMATGMKPLGTIREKREDDEGAYYEVDLFDTAYVRELIPGLEAGEYGASFQFDTLREEWVDKPKPAAHNPQGIPERTVKEARVREFGPVTFPAYANASAGMLRSLTDFFRRDELAGDPAQLRALDAFIYRKAKTTPAPDAASSTSGPRAASAPAAISRTARVPITREAFLKSLRERA